MTPTERDRFELIRKALDLGVKRAGAGDAAHAAYFLRHAHETANDLAEIMDGGVAETAICAKCMNACTVTPPVNTPTPSTGRDFSWALLHLKAGNAVRRRVWGRSRLYYSDAARMLIYVCDDGRGKATTYPWRATQQSMLANDWELVEP